MNVTLESATPNAARTRVTEKVSDTTDKVGTLGRRVSRSEGERKFVPLGGTLAMQTNFLSVSFPTSVLTLSPVGMTVLEMSEFNDNRSMSEAKRAIVLAARQEIRISGILGLRIAAVAANAHYSASAIYRYFGDRNGLLAAVLSELYEELLDGRRAAIAKQFPAEGPLSIDDIVHLAPSPSEMADSEELRLRLQIMAVAATNPALEQRISEIAQRRFEEMRAFLRYLQSRLAPGQYFDERVFTVLLVNQLLYYNTLLGDHAADDESYYAFLKHVASGCARPPTD
jgi:AcrR family transcriptional regulator